MNRPTRDELLAIAHDPSGATAQAAIERWGIDLLMDPYAEPGPPGGVGLGDLVAKITRTVGVKPCGPCERRRRKLNRWRLGG